MCGYNTIPDHSYETSCEETECEILVTDDRVDDYCFPPQLNQLRMLVDDSYSEQQL